MDELLTSSQNQEKLSISFHKLCNYQKNRVPWGVGPIFSGLKPATLFFVGISTR